MLAATAYIDTQHFVLWFVLTAIASWRLAHMFVFEHGPWGLFAVIRRLFGAQKKDVLTFKKQNVLSCVWCLSIWIVPVFAWAPGFIVVIFALSGCVVMMHEVVATLGSVQNGNR